MFQRTGSFKARGAINSVLQTKDKCSCYVTHSSGNHGQAVAYAASLFNKKSIIVMPYNSLKCKIKSVRYFQGGGDMDK